MGKIADRLKELNIELPASTFAAKAKSVPWRRAGNLVFLGGASPQWNGEFVYTKRLGDEIGIEEGQKAARLTAINMLHRLGMACDGEVPAAATCESPHSPPKYRAAKSRHQTKHGGST